MKRILFSALTAGLFLLIPQGASASCMMDERTVAEQIAEAPTVFVGTVESLSSNDRTALFVVEEVWKGGLVPAKVTVRGGPDGNAFTSVDRTFEARRYLVFPYGSASHFTDNSCSPTRPWSDDLAQYRPAGATGPASVSPVTPDRGSNDAKLLGVRTQTAAIVIGALLVLILGWLLLQRTRRSRT